MDNMVHTVKNRYLYVISLTVQRIIAHHAYI